MLAAPRISALEHVSWEQVLVAMEILGAIALALWIIRRRVRHDQLMLHRSEATFFELACSPLMHVQGCWSLRSVLRYRIAAAAFFAVVEIVDLVRTHLRCIVMYTSWNFVLQGAYFGVAAWRTLAVWKQRELTSRGMYAPLVDAGPAARHAAAADDDTQQRCVKRRGSWPRLELVLDVCLSTSLVVAVVVWTILYPYAVRTNQTWRLLNAVSYSQHGINVVLLQIDFFACRHSVSLDALPLMLLWPTLYCVFTWIVHGSTASGFWPYPFLDVQTPWAPIWYAMLLGAHLAAFAVMRLASRFKESQHELAVVVIEANEDDDKPQPADDASHGEDGVASPSRVHDHDIWRSTLRV